MGIGLEVISGELSAEHIVKTTGSAIILNDETLDSESVEKVSFQLMTTVEGDPDFSPTCACGNLTGNITTTGDATCKLCKGRLLYMGTDPIKSMLFLRTPVGLDGMLIPFAWQMIENAFIKGTWNLVMWLTDPNYRITNHKIGDPIIRAMENSGIERGYNFFINNLEKIITVASKLPQYANKPSVVGLLEYYLDNKANIHTNYIAFPNKALLIVEKTPVKTYLEPGLLDLFNVVRSVVGIDELYYNDRQRESVTARAMSDLGKWIVGYIDKIYAGKYGGIRAHIFKNKSVISGMGVITSLTDVHDPDTLMIPWPMAVQMFKIHIIGYLIRNGDSINDALRKIHKYTYTYDVEIHDILNKLKEEDGYITVIAQRFPSLGPTSILTLKADFWLNPKILAIGLSILRIVGLNADYDGDKIIIHPCLDRASKRAWEPFKYFYGILDKTVPRKVTGQLALSGPVVATISAWHAESDILVSDKQTDDKLVAMFG